MKLIKALLLFLLIFTILPSCNKNDNSYTITNWQISYSSVSSFNDITKGKDWKPIENITNIKLPHPSGKSTTKVWLKADFTLSHPNTYFGITMDSVNLWDKTYINGSPVSSGSEIFGTFDQPRAYPIPKSVLKKEANTIVIELTSHKNWTLGISGNISLLPLSDFNRFILTGKISHEYLPVAISVLFLGLIISLLIKFFYNTDEKEHCYLALRLIIAIVFFISIMFPFRFLSIRTTFILWDVLTPLILITFFLYYQSLYNLYFTNLNKILISFCIFLSLLGFVAPIVNQNTDLSPYLFAMSFSVSIAYCIYLLFKMNSIKTNWFTFYHIAIEIGLFLIFIISLLLFFLAGIRGWNDPSVVLIITTGFISINTIIYYAQRDSRNKILFNQLVEKYKLDTELSDKKQAISVSAEDRLKQLIGFIQENYMHPLSRESLAEIIGMNSNYLSSLFNTYTGKSISEYINMLRIEAAAKLLKREKQSIIDIAFEVGFNSLATFNRSFKKQMATTPSEYKTTNI